VRGRRSRRQRSRRRPAATVEEVNVTNGQQISTGGTGGASSGSSGTATHAIVIITPGVFEVTGSVSDALVNEIAVGQAAQVVAAGSSAAVSGKVSSVAEAATVTSGVATFPVTVVLSGANPALRPGMSASVSVVINQVVGVTTVPTSAVHTTGTGSTVTLYVNGKPVPTAVTVGASDATLTQILSGVKVGDQVVIATNHQHDSVVHHRGWSQPHRRRLRRRGWLRWRWWGSHRRLM